MLTLLLGLHYAPIALGVCAAILERNHNFTAHRFTRLLATLAIIATACIMTVSESEYVSGPFFAVAIVIATAIPGKRSEIAKIAGGLSYPLYLNQWIAGFAVHFVAKRWFPLEKWLSITVTFAAAFIMALAMYWFIDRQVHDYRDNWYSPALGRLLGRIAYCLVAVGIIGGGLIHLYGPHGTPSQANVEARATIDEQEKPAGSGDHF